jgi:hypothetical protein
MDKVNFLKGGEATGQEGDPEKFVKSMATITQIDSLE